METIDAPVKRAEVESYYASGVEAGMLQRYRVAYVIGGPQPPGWSTVFESGGIAVYGP
jgi:hypothetical protein